MRSPSTVASTWARALSIVVAVFASLTLADVEFTEPAAGANLTAGQIDVKWKDSGISPPIDELTQYTLSLMVGGNDLNDMVSLLLAGLYAAPKLMSLAATCSHIRIRR